MEWLKVDGLAAVGGEGSLYFEEHTHSFTPQK
jgi:hypothetical protein